MNDIIKTKCKCCSQVIYEMKQSSSNPRVICISASCLSRPVSWHCK